MEAEEHLVRLEVADTHIELCAPGFDIRFKSREAFRRFREWVETARVIGEGRSRPLQTSLKGEHGEEWYVLSMGEGNVALHHLSESEIDWTVLLPEEQWREIGHVVLSSSAEVP